MLEKTYIRHENIISRKILDEVLLVPIQGTVADMQRIHTLNPVAEYIWQNLDGQKTIQEILNGVLDTFNVPKDVACADLLEFIQQLHDNRLIKELS